uniref:DDE Tnp4 domain-containing protein n=1 Tax=Paramormyrops kingsleyae TaxID=1676925 RepID=A0A3B3RMC0_9TELE
MAAPYECMLSVPNHLHNTLQRNCMSVFALGEMTSSIIGDLIRPKLQHKTQRNHALSVEEQCIITLHCNASGTVYQVVGDNMGVDKSTVSNVVRAVSVELASLLNESVSFPKDDQMAQTKQSFFLLGNMPNTIGVIDCTHVHIQAPHEREFSIQLVGNVDFIITNCVVKWPGSVYDARVLRESALYRELQSNRPNGIILGDSAYPLLPWLMAPFPVANTPEQAGFNSRLNVLKRRFACLKTVKGEYYISQQMGKIKLCRLFLNTKSRAGLVIWYMPGISPVSR